ncbi:MAG: S9 family peptidase [Fimbriimonadaceae bacterium]|nr:S9 family peptidase [Fimbriimonadaceae bacterium]
MPKRPITPDDLLRFHFVGDPQISPDGTRVLFVKKHVDAAKNKYVSHLYSVDRDGRATQLTQGAGGAGNPRWSPDGGHVAFLSGRDKPAGQIYLLPMGGGEARKLTAFPEGSVGSIAWSPDGAKIACTFREQHPDWTEAAKKEREAKGAGTPPRVMDDLWYRLDGDGYFMGQRHAVYIVDVATGEHRLLYNASALDSYDFDWSPDSKELAIIHTANKRPFSDPANDQIYRVDLDGKAWKLDGLPKGDKSNVRWSPDGKTIAYLGNVDEEDPWGVRNTRLWKVPAEGGEATCLTPEDDVCLTTGTISDAKEVSYSGYLRWAPDSTKLYVNPGVQGGVWFGDVDARLGGIRWLVQGNECFEAGPVSRDGRAVGMVVSDPTRLGEIAWLDLTEERLVPERLTAFNKPLLDELKLSEPEEFWVESTDGTKVHTWVMKPVDYLAPKRYPAVLEIHGGPHTQYGWTFFHEFQVLAAQGYVVVYSNPRGSKGYSEAHCAAIKGDWGNKDWDDVQAVTRFAQHLSYVHPGQMGVMGGSYGGYMTNWVIGHTKDFRAAITDRCVSNMVSMGGSSDFPFNKDGYFKGVCWGDLEKIRELWRQSPLAYFENVTTPTLIIHSEGDLRCNIEQSEQVFTALQMQGVESRFVRYPVETFHGMSRNGPPDLRLHRLGEILRWWERHLKTSA